MPKYLLQFLSGPEAGRELSLRPGAEVVIGRSKSVDLTIKDSQASRRHSRVYFQGEQLMIEDLDSINGTCVNGKRIQKTKLAPGDQVKIGEFGLKIVAGQEISVAAQEWWNQTQARKGAREHSMTGSLKSVSLVDLLQLLCNSGQSGLIKLVNGSDVGMILLRNGQIAYASINDQTSRPATKTFFRLLTWKSGRFEFGPSQELDVETEINEPASGLLLEGVQEADKLAALGPDVPALSSKLRLTVPMPEKLSALRSEQLDALQLVLEKQTVLGVLNHFPGTDLEAYEALLELRNRGFINTN